MTPTDTVSIERAENGSAVYDEQHTYRYLLTRKWDDGSPPICWVLLNPSTATASDNDPTIARAVGFSRSWGFGSLAVVNLFAQCGTDPVMLSTANDPVGPHNNVTITETAATSPTVVLGWGTHGDTSNPATGVPRSREVLRMLDHLDPVCLGRTRSGQPRHPLYLPGSLSPVPYLR